MSRHSFHHLPFYGNKADIILKSYSGDGAELIDMLMPPSPDKDFDDFSPQSYFKD